MKEIKKILVIDDEEQDRKSMALVLEKQGYKEITCADTGEKGIEMALSIKPDVIVIDVVLQNCDGFDVCKRIKDAKELSSKIIMITGHLDAIDANKARHSGADEIIEKIPGFENVGRTINNILGP
ncbi:MAG: response regulator [Candidatus Omnitrophota bacterium]